MSMHGPKSLHLFIVSISMFACIGGCSINAPYHTLRGNPGNCQGVSIDSNCTRSYYQEYDRYDLAFAEYSDRGNAFSDFYIDDILERIDQKAYGQGVILITFIHGWKHSAVHDDVNLSDFKRTLQAISDSLLASNTKDQRRVIGLYIGWRGASVKLPGFENTTFWNRKAVAEEVGKGGVTRLVMELDAVMEQRDDNVMVVIGHSFGGAIVVSALTEILTERIAMHSRSGLEFVRTIGDSVLVLNPAIEANKALPLIETAIRANYHRAQPPVFISLSSVADTATHFAFPTGQSLFPSGEQSHLERKYYYDRLNPNKKILMSEEDLDTTTVGNYAPFLTHHLSSTTIDNSIRFHIKNCEDIPTACAPLGITSLNGLPTIRKPRNFPLYFIRTDASIIEDHNDIFNPRVRAFLVAIVGDVLESKSFEREGAIGATESVLNSPCQLGKRMESIIKSW